MKTPAHWARLAVLGLTLSGWTGAPGTPLLAEDAAPEAAAMARLAWRPAGPANDAGRVTAFVGVPGEPAIMYVAGAAGGIFKTTNGGVTWKPIFDDQPVASIGAIAIAPSNPNVVYVGTGEGNPRNNVSFGNGVYRSVDGGGHWTHLGLGDTDRIPRIVVDPGNADRAYVCALGHTWGPNEDRGVFRTRDGGRSWKKVLYVNDLTGCSDLDIDPGNANVVYAGMYSHRRRAWSFESGGGETALYKSTNGGGHWERLSGPDANRGLPAGPMDRIGVSVARSDPRVVYVVSETRGEGQLWRTADAGKTWQTVHRDPHINFRPFYYSDIRVDPGDADTVYSLSAGLYRSTDGGRTFARIGSSVHGDHQALWIDPLDPRRLLDGSDGGFQISHDRGRTFDVLNNIAFTEFYHVDMDLQTPYTVCGGLQDGGTWCGPSRSLSTEGTRKRDWFPVGGGDGFYAVPDPSAPWLVYNSLQGGVISLTDVRSGASWPIDPYPNRLGSSGDAVADHKYRFNWNAPLVLSPHDPSVVYFGGNVLFRTTDRGRSWDVISPDLTTNDKRKQQSSGGPVVRDNTGAEFHCTILSIAPSPVDRDVIWVGTDDGHVQVTRDGGTTWTNVFVDVPGLAPHAWIATVEASRRDAGIAYVAASHHQDDDYAPYFYKTADFGRTWTRITDGLPARGWAHVIREDPRNPDLLYAGTETGVFASWDHGRRWASIRNGLPPVPVRDLKVHPRDGDIVLATHGRGVFILDDAAPLAALGDAMKAGTFLFEVRPATRWVIAGRDGSLGDREWSAPGPPAGATIDYYLGETTREPVRMTIVDGRGSVVRTLRGLSGQAGINRVVWDLLHDTPVDPEEDGQGDEAPSAESRPRAVIDAGPAVLPGLYTVTLTVGERSLSRPVEVGLDPRVETTLAELASQQEAAFAVLRLAGRILRMVERVDHLTGQLASLHAQLQSLTSGEANGPVDFGPVPGDVAAVLAKLRTLRDTTLTRPGHDLPFRQYPRLREEVLSLATSIQRGFRAPNAGERIRMTELADEAATAAARLERIIDSDLARINEGTTPFRQVLKLVE